MSLSLIIGVIMGIVAVFSSVMLYKFAPTVEMSAMESECRLERVGKGGNARPGSSLRLFSGATLIIMMVGIGVLLGFPGKVGMIIGGLVYAWGMMMLVTAYVFSFMCISRWEKQGRDIPADAR